jgi:hypothetical protein
VRLLLRALPVFAATLNATDPLPVPVAPDVIVIHAALLLAVQEHPAAVATENAAPTTPPAPNDWLLGLIS